LHHFRTFLISHNQNFKPATVRTTEMDVILVPHNDPEVMGDKNILNNNQLLLRIWWTRVSYICLMAVIVEPLKLVIENGYVDTS